MIARRLTLPILTAALTVLTTVPAAVTLSSHRTVITREQIRKSGIVRLSEILLLEDRWAPRTLDNFTWHYNPNALSMPGQQYWRVLVNGQEMDIDVFDKRNISLLPFSTEEIDSVVVINEPTFAGGFVATQGLVHFHLSHPDSGVAARARVIAGNETGDPGPYAYTDRATPNVDRIGPDGSISVGGTTDRAWATATATVSQFRFTNRAMRQRIQALQPPESEDDENYPFAESGSPALVALGGLVTAGYRGAGGTHRLVLGGSDEYKYYLYTEMFGREMPARHMMRHAGINGTVRAGALDAVSYRLQYSRNKLEREPNTIDFEYDWARARTDALLQWERSRRRTRYSVGARVTGEDVTSESIDTNARRTLYRVFGELTRRAPKTRYETGLTVTGTSGAVAPAIYARARRDVALDHELGLSVSYSDRLPEEDNTLWHWVENGYSILDDNAIAYSFQAPLERSRSATLDFAWKAHMAVGRQLNVTLSWRWFGDAWAERRDFMYDSTACAFTASHEVLTGLNGNVALVHASFPHTLGGKVNARASYDFTAVASGSGVFRDVWATTPAHRASYSILFEPAHSFSIWTRVLWHSSTRWRDYDTVDGVVCTMPGLTYEYQSTIDDVILLDARLTKWMWKHRFAFDLMGRGSLGSSSSYQFHPAGARTSPVFYLQLRLEMP